MATAGETKKKAEKAQTPVSASCEETKPELDDSVDLAHKRMARKYSRGRWPLAGATAAGTAGVTAAVLVGVPEVLLGLAVGYATYEIMRHRMGLLKALQAAAKLERDFFRL